MNRWDTGGGGHRRIMAKHQDPVWPSFFSVFLTTVFMVRNLAERDCVPFVEGKRGCIMFVMSAPAQNNVMLGTATHCCLF